MMIRIITTFFLLISGCSCLRFYQVYGDKNFSSYIEPIKLAISRRFDSTDYAHSVTFIPYLFFYYIQ